MLGQVTLSYSVVLYRSAAAVTVIELSLIQHQQMGWIDLSVLCTYTLEPRVAGALKATQ